MSLTLYHQAALYLYSLETYGCTNEYWLILDWVLSLMLPERHHITAFYRSSCETVFNTWSVCFNTCLFACDIISSSPLAIYAFEIAFFSQVYVWFWSINCTYSMHSKIYSILCPWKNAVWCLCLLSIWNLLLLIGNVLSISYKFGGWYYYISCDWYSYLNDGKFSVEFIYHCIIIVIINVVIAIKGEMITVTIHDFYGDCTKT